MGFNKIQTIGQAVLGQGDQQEDQQAGVERGAGLLQVGSSTRLYCTKASANCRNMAPRRRSNRSPVIGQHPQIIVHRFLHLVLQIARSPPASR